MLVWQQIMDTETDSFDNHGRFRVIRLTASQPPSESP